MKVLVVIFACVAGAVAYNNRESFDNNDFGVEVASNILPDASGKLFWNKLGTTLPGSNQVGGSGIWATLQNKFPFISGLLSSRMEYPSTYYGTPNHYPQFPNNVYSPPVFYQYQYPDYTPQYPTFNPQFPRSFNQFPSNNQFPGREIQLTDDAVIVTNPQFPSVPQPVPEPAPQPEGYQYSKPQFRLNLPQK